MCFEALRDHLTRCYDKLVNKTIRLRKTGRWKERSQKAKSQEI